MSGRMRLAVWGLTLVALLCAPAAEAGVRITAVHGPTQLIQPAIESPALDVDAVVDCDAPTAVVSPRLNVELDWSAPVGVAVIGDPHVQASCEVGSATAPVHGRFSIVIARSTPGLTPLALVLNASLQPGFNDPLVNATSDSTVFTVRAAPFFYGRIDADSKLAECGCPVRYELTFTNQGNVRTTFATRLSIEPREGTVTLPPPTSVEPGHEATVPLTFTAQVGTGFVNREAPFQVIVSQSSTDEPSLTSRNEFTANFLVRLRSTSHASPGAGVELVPVLLGLALLVSRRRA